MFISTQKKINNKAVIYQFIFGFFLMITACLPVNAQTTYTLTVNQAGSNWYYIFPCDVTSATVEVWGGGGGGGSAQSSGARAGGGSGGAYTRGIIPITAGTVYNITVGAGGASATDGEASSFNTAATIMAIGGKAGQSINTSNTQGTGGIAPGTGNVNTGASPQSYYGGNGGNATSGGSGYSGGGGGSAGNASNGNNAVAGTGGAAVASGGAGANGNNSNGAGNAGSNPGGGGSGGRAGNGTLRAGGNGGDGQVVITFTTSLPLYCAPDITFSIEPITLVQFAGINNTTPNTSTYPSESFCFTASVNPGTSYPITLKGNTDGNFTDYFTVFIDWDHNGVFNNTTERYDIGTITNSTGSDAITATNNILVPLGATTGITAMRVAKRFNAYPTDACTDIVFGQFEDYQVNVLPLPACSGMPAASTTISSANPVCSGINFTLSLSTTYSFSGITYQWQSADDAAFTVNLANLGTASTQVTSQTTNKYYRCLISCGANTRTSTYIYITTSGTCYCIPTVTNKNTYFSNVTSQSARTNFTNTTGKNGYADYFATKSCSAMAGDIIQFSVTIAGGSAGVAIYVDWDNNGTFIPSELMFTSGAYLLTGTTNFIPMQIPTGVLPGDYRMRFVVDYWSSNPDACVLASGLRGEMEDYKISILSSWSCNTIPSTSGSHKNNYNITQIRFEGTLSDPAPNNTGVGLLNGYSDYTGLAAKASQEQGEGINVVTTVTNRSEIAAWVDWNKDGYFDTRSEQVYMSENVVFNSTVFGFQIPLATVPGNYRLRIRSYNWADDLDAPYATIYPCGDYHNGETEDYLFTVLPRCNARIASVAGQTKCSSTAVGFNLSATATNGSTSFKWYNAETLGTYLGATGASGMPPSTTYNTAAINTTTTYWVTAVGLNSLGAACETPVRVPVVALLKPVPVLSFSPASPIIICGDGAGVNTTATASTEIAYLINEDFEGGNLGAFTVNTPVALPNAVDMQWQNQTSVYVPSVTNSWKPAISSGFGTNKFIYSVSELLDGDLTTRLVSGVLNSNQFTNLTLEFDIYYSHYYTDGNNSNGGSGVDTLSVQASSNGGTTWGTLAVYNADQGFATKFKHIVINLPAGYLNSNNLKLRFIYDADWVHGAALDNIKLYGEKSVTTNYAWTPVLGNTGGKMFTDPAFSMPYSSGSIPNLYIKPTGPQVTAGTDLVFQASATLSNGCAVTGNVTVKIAPNTWLGNTADWHTPSNWCGGYVPLATTSVLIPAGVPYMPVISAAATCKYIIIDPTASLEVDNTGSFNVKTDMVNNGDLNNKGRIELNGTVLQNFPGPGTISKMKILEINNSGPGVKINKSFSIDSALLSTQGQFDLDNFDVTIRSTSNNTARVGPVAGSFHYGTGRFIVEHFIKTPRKWQHLSTPSNTLQSINAAWQEGMAPGSNTQTTPAGYGTQISTKLPGVPTLIGFDSYSPGGPSMKSWNVATQSYDAPANTTLGIANLSGYMIFVRGDRTQVGAAGNSTTTLRTRGQLFTGTQSAITIPAGNYVSLGNPYASALGMDNLLPASAVQSFYVWDPNLGGIFNIGGFQVFTKVGSDWIPTPGSGSYDKVTGSAIYDSSYIPSGRAFFVRGNTTGSLSFKESNKASDEHVASFTSGNPQLLRPTLYLRSAGELTMVDGVMLHYEDGFNKDIDNYDIPKFDNISENLSILVKGQPFAVIQNPPISKDDTVYLSMAAWKQHAYSWNINCMNMDATGREGWLIDKFTQMHIPLQLDRENMYDFEVTASALSRAADRFMIVFKQAGVVPVRIVSIEAHAVNAGKNAVNWVTENEVQLQRYEVERSNDGIHFVNIHEKAPLNNGGRNTYAVLDEQAPNGVCFYRIKSVDADGEFSYSAIVKVVLKGTGGYVSIVPNPVKNKNFKLKIEQVLPGNYTYTLVAADGKIVLKHDIQINDTNYQEVIKIDQFLASGYYTFYLYDKLGKIEEIPLIIE